MSTIHEVTDQKEVKCDSSSPFSNHDAGEKVHSSKKNDHNDPQHPKHYFTKHYDVVSGKFYHVIKATDECIWDRPKGQSVPLECYESQKQSTLLHTDFCSQQKN